MSERESDRGGSPEAAERTRLRWLCRRGTRELDLLLTRYLDEAWADAPEAEKAAFARLLEFQDPDLYALLTGRDVETVENDAALDAVVRRIRTRAGL